MALRRVRFLLTLGDTETRRRYLNARATIETLLEWNAIPIINENDSVATSEIRYGDNDRLAARVASMAGADLLILLSDVDGLYDAPPATNPDANFLAEVPNITPEIEAMAGDAGSGLSRGGMKTKIEAAKIATSAGTTMVIASGKLAHPLAQLNQGAKSTWFAPSSNPINERKKWIAGGLEITGSISIDQGALVALKSGKRPTPSRRHRSIRRILPRRHCRYSWPQWSQDRPRIDRVRFSRREQDHWLKEFADRKVSRPKRKIRHDSSR